MPILNVKLCAPHTPETPAKIAAALTDLTVEILRKKRELTAVTIEHVQPSAWFIGARALSDEAMRTFYLEIKVTEGTNTKEEKAQYISRVFAAMEGIVGALAPASYIVIQEVRADVWGYQGQTQEFRYIKGKAL